MASESVHCIVTSPPYWGLRDYGVDGQIGLEPTPEEYVANMVGIFHELRRVLRDDGTLWLNLGDSYANDGKWGGTTGGKHAGALHGQNVGRGKRDTGLKPKDLVGIPWRVAFALQADGWWLRQDIIWSKPNPMPESVTDRCTKSHEYIFMLSKSARYYYDQESIKEPAIYCDQENPDAAVYKDARSFDGKHTDKQRGHGRRHAGFNDRWDRMTREQQCSAMRNRRDVWTVATAPYKGAHFATFPPDLIKPCILAGCPQGGTVLDPFLGSGTTAQVAIETGRNYIGVELNPKYIELAERRIREAAGQPELPWDMATALETDVVVDTEEVMKMARDG